LNGNVVSPGELNDVAKTTLVTHKAGVNAMTAPGVYTQQVTYTVIANF
jgi:hypothetical protein